MREREERRERERERPKRQRETINRRGVDIVAANFTAATVPKPGVHDIVTPGLRRKEREGKRVVREIGGDRKRKRGRGRDGAGREREKEKREGGEIEERSKF